tara:strand:- start:1143 stop:1820 length:678 start_codon:yes stop_codon:yes gene_type:complete
MPGFMDTFFFLSLGIAFVLILLLVYHFKQRLTATENKCDTMFEIINGLASEVNNMKGALIARAPPRPVQMPPQMGGMPLPPGPMFSNMSNENVNKANIQDLENDDEITEEEDSDDEEDEDENEEESGDEDEEEESGDEEEEEEDSDDEEGEEREDMDVIGTKMIIQEDNSEEKIMVSDSEEVVEEKPDYEKMNLVNLKKYVIENGLIENPRKMKKSEIIEALSSM